MAGVVRAEVTRVYLAAHGDFVAPNLAVAEKLILWTKAAMVRQCLDSWPGVFTRDELRAMPSYVLAVILCQI